MELDKTLSDIKKYISLKNTTQSGDIVIVGTPGGIFYGVVRDIGPDIKKNWYSVQLTLLVLPPVDLSWKLREPQMTGEIFTIEGREHFMAAVDFTSPESNRDTDDCTNNSEPERPGNVLQFTPKQ